MRGREGRKELEFLDSQDRGAKTSVEVLAAQLVTKRERGRDIGTERAMGGRAEDPIQSTAGRPPREEEEKGRLYSLGRGR